MEPDNLDLPADLARAMRSVPPADPRAKDAHISAALAAFDASSARSTGVVGIESRRRVLLTSAAAALLVVGAGIGWVVHSPHASPVAADVSVGSVQSDAVTTQAPTTTLAKGIAPDQFAPQPNKALVGAASVCDFWGRQDLKYVGSYTTGLHAYVLMQQGSSVVWYDKDSCTQVMSVGGPTTTAP